MLNQHQTKFVKQIERIERSEGLRPFEAFSAFLELGFCSLAKPSLVLDAADKMEARYMEQIGHFRHPKETAPIMAEAMTILVDGLEDKACDFLGDIHMEVGANARTGQFFTPWALCQMMAEITLDNDLEEKAKAGHIITIQEPACGFGATVLAMAEVLKARGIDPARQAHFTLVDIDPRCVQGAFIQCSLMGLSATVIHGNTLSLETWGGWETFVAFLHPKRHRIRAQQRATEQIEITEQADAAVVAPAITSLQPTATKHQQQVLEL